MLEIVWGGKQRREHRCGSRKCGWGRDRGEGRKGIGGISGKIEPLGL